MAQNDHAGDDRGVDAALAEFGVLRAEMLNCRTAQAGFVGVGVAAIGVIFPVALRQAGDNGLLLVVPPLAFVVSLLHLAESLRIHRLGNFIRLVLWPYLNQNGSYDGSWEAWRLQREKRWTLRGILTAVFSEGPVPILFAVAGAVALAYVKTTGTFAWAAGLVCVILTAVGPILFAFAFKRAGAVDRRDQHR